MGFQSLVEIAPWTIIVQICNLLLQMLLIRKFLVKPVQDIIRKRREEVDKIYEDAEQDKLSAASAKTEYEGHLATAKIEASEMIAKATRNAEAKSEAIIGDAQKEASSIKEKAFSDIEAEKKKAVNEIKDDISDIAIAIAEKVVEKEIDEKTHGELIDRFIEELK